MSERLYLAYGSNLNLEQMRFRCPDAKVAGTAVLQGRRLLFKGSLSGNYLTVEPAEGFSVPVAVWSVTPRDEQSLDVYEGFPHFYYKKDLTVTMRDIATGEEREVDAFLYIMHEDRTPGRPSESYLERCREGYEAFGFDPALLAEACEYSSRG